jgi:NADP-dependent 3-hydroxy acid dehydrogenase YdfG
MAHFTQIYRSESYPAISPSSSHNSRAGRTILITGACGGLAFPTIHAFIPASATIVILPGRKHESIIATIEKLEAIRPPGLRTQLIPFESDVNNLASIEELWKVLAKDGIAVDVLILNAAAPYRGLILNGAEQLWALFETNVLANIRMADKFLGQGPEAGKVVRRGRLTEMLTDQLPRSCCLSPP